jgi:nitric oxide reductase subunit C
LRIVHRQLLVIALLGAFAAQGTLVYGDDKAAAYPPFSALEQRGRAVFLENNCYACHQIYGFGGFLGPDLTNAAQRVPRARLDELLTKGSLQMPAFGLPSADIDALEAWLRAIDRTGIGVARCRVPPPLAAVQAAVQRRVDALPPADPVARGHRLFCAICSTCHLPLRANPLGTAMAPDPSGIRARLSPAEVDQVLQQGRSQRGMPPAPLDSQQRPDVIAFLGWLHAARGDLLAECGTDVEQGLPWWEFR